MTKTNIRRMEIKEFREHGYLQELNRNFLHPLGLALEVVTDETGEETLGGVWDYRDDRDGMLYSDSLITDKFKQKAENVKKEFDEKAKIRSAKHGFVIQPTH